MVSSFNDAISAYRNAAAGKTDTVAERVTGTGNTVDPGESFADMVRGAAYDARDTMVNSEQMTQKAITGDAELHEVVTAVSAAECRHDGVKTKPHDRPCGFLFLKSHLIQQEIMAIGRPYPV